MKEKRRLKKNFHEGELRKIFSEHLARSIASKGWSADDLELHAGRFTRKGSLSRGLVQSYLRGVAFPNSNTLMAICLALGVRSSDLVPAFGIVRDKALAESSATSCDRTNFEIRAAGEGRVWLYVDQAVSPAAALRIALILGV